MALFIYPHSASDLSTATDCSTALSLPCPLAWGDDLLEKRVIELVSQRITTDSTTLNTIGLPVIILAGINREQLHEVLRWYKARSQWPIFATLTEQSLQMTFQELLEDLLQDRAQEAAVRQQKKN